MVVVDGRIEQAPDCVNEAFGNFYLQPNGFFAVKANGDVVVAQRSAYVSPKCELRSSVKAFRFALQSGPMLVVNDRLPRRFLAEKKDAPLYVRSGVGVGKDGVFSFALSLSEVSLGRFARFFKDRVGAVNALYLDGRISRAYAPQSNWSLDDVRPFGGVLAVFAKPLKSKRAPSE
ncbi:hypothetical protein CCP2SC5_1760005 [Azospirillaceae bacterium]